MPSFFPSTLPPVSPVIFNVFGDANVPTTSPRDPPLLSKCQFATCNLVLLNDNVRESLEACESLGTCEVFNS